MELFIRVSYFIRGYREPKYIAQRPPALIIIWKLLLFKYQEKLRRVQITALQRALLPVLPASVRGVAGRCFQCCRARGRTVSVLPGGSSSGRQQPNIHQRLLPAGGEEAGRRMGGEARRRSRGRGDGEWATVKQRMVGEGKKESSYALGKNWAVNWLHAITYDANCTHSSASFK